MKNEGNILRLSEIAIFAIHHPVNPHSCERSDEFVPIAIFIDRSTTGGSFLFQAIEEAGKSVLNIVRLLSDDPQVAKPSLVQTANMIEIHYVLEDETAARLHSVPKNQSGLQGLVIIDPMERGEG